MVFGCGRYSLAVADIVVADMVCGQYGRTPQTCTLLALSLGVKTNRYPDPPLS